MATDFESPIQYIDEVYNVLMSESGTGERKVKVPGGVVGVRNHYFSREFYYEGVDEHGRKTEMRDNSWKSIGDILYTL